ncbi:hypothetical protein [Actinocrispum sp. NPDC049592]|uniref:hypothetical protein n=1 Tax=Actinocrispum sp. NPDC049592 TaxID=3154835 RepID=UPI0034332030
MIDFSKPVGPATYAMRQLRPNERLLWATYGTRLRYDVRGLDDHGEPDRSVLAKIGSGVGGAVLEVISPTEDYDRPDPPQLVVFGGHRPEFLRGLPIRPGTGLRVWALTSERFMVIDGVAPVQAPEPAPEPDRSLLAKAIGFGKAVVAVGKDLAQSFAEATRSYGSNTAGEPVAIRPTQVCGEVPRQGIAGFAVARHGSLLRGRPCLRMSLVDGTGVDFLLDSKDPALFEWMLAQGAR